MALDDPILYYVCDIFSGEILEEVPFKGWGHGRAKNAPGGWSADISHRHKIVTGNPNLLEPWRRRVFAARGTDVIGGGLLVTKQENTSSGITVGGQGLFDYYREGRRSIRSRLGMNGSQATGSSSLEITFTNQDQFNIVLNLLDHAAAYAGLANISYDEVLFRGPGVGGLSGVNRTKTYWSYERKNIGDAIMDLAKLYGGFEWSEVSYFEGNFIKTRLELHYPWKGLESGIEFESGRNVLLLDRSVDGTEQATRFTATGSGTDDAQQQVEKIDLTMESPTGSFPMLEGIENFQDYTLSMLDAQAQRGLNQYKRPQETIKMRVMEDANIPLGSFDWGDVCRVVVQDGGIQVNGTYRIESYEVTIDDKGKITIEPTAVSFDPSVGL